MDKHPAPNATPVEGCPTRGSRRSRSAWTPAEIESLISGVKQYGRGNWATICLKMNFSSRRTPTDLKDKWRSLSETRPHSQLPENLKSTIKQINSEQDKRFDFAHRQSDILSPQPTPPSAQGARPMSEEEIREIIKKFTTDNVQELALELLRRKDQTMAISPCPDQPQ